IASQLAIDLTEGEMRRFDLRMALIESTYERGEGFVRIAAPSDLTGATQPSNPMGAGRVGTMAPYDRPYEHLADLLARHDWLLRRELGRGHRREPTDVLGFAAITDDEVNDLLSGGARRDDGERAAKLREIEQVLDDLVRRIDSRVAQTLACKRRLPIIDLAHHFAWSALAID